MLNLEIVHRRVEAIEDAVGTFTPVGRRELVPSLATREAVAALAREQEHAAIEAEDVMSQADEALVLG
jgi:hypothetical protein